MKVIERVPWKFEFTCSGCKSKLECEADDVLLGYFGPSWGGESPEPKWYCKCSVCGDTKVIDDEHGSKVPTDIQNAARARSVKP